MRSPQRIAISITISLCLFTLACIRLCNRNTPSYKAWDSDFERQLYDLYFKQASSYTDFDKAKSKYATCCIEHVKAMFPNGLPQGTKSINATTRDSITNAGQGCIEIIKDYQPPWNPERIKHLKSQFYAFEETKSLSKNKQDKYVDCIANKVMQEFPYGLSTGTSKEIKDFIQKSKNECFILLGGKKAKTTTNN